MACALAVLFGLPILWTLVPSAGSLVYIGVVVAVALLIPIGFLFDSRRRKVPGYVGKFRREDGSIVHVARLDSGRLWAADDNQSPGPIGYVTGRQLVGWTKLADEPDGPLLTPPSRNDPTS